MGESIWYPIGFGFVTAAFTTMTCARQLGAKNMLILDAVCFAFFFVLWFVVHK